MPLQNVSRRSGTWSQCMMVVFLSSIISPLYSANDKIMYVHLWQTVSALAQVLFWCLFPALLCNAGNKHQNNPLMRADTVHHSGLYIIPYTLLLACSITAYFLSKIPHYFFHHCLTISMTPRPKMVSHSLQDVHPGSKMLLMGSQPLQQLIHIPREWCTQHVSTGFGIHPINFSVAMFNGMLKNPQ